MIPPKKYKARPEELPPPTYWPFLLALGVCLIFWGVLTTWVISGMGLLIFTVAIVGWLGDIVNEPSRHDTDSKNIPQQTTKTAPK